MRINRGKLSLEGIAEKALELDAEKAVIVDRWKGGLGKIQFFRISEKGLDAVPPLIYVRDIKLRRDFRGNMPKGRRIKSVAMASSRKAPLEVKRLEKALSEFFGIPILPFDEVVNRKYDAAMRISADLSNCIIITFKLMPKLVEVGPRLRVSHLVWELIR
ncbi:MAG: hypothetical protein ACP5ER_01250 [Candidatus Bathyarchaeales archaeon]